MKPRACVTCGKEFTKPAYLQRHVRTHTGERPYNCYYCDRTFKRKDHAKKHMMTHERSNLVTFTCSAEGCEKKFKLEQTMKRHIDIAHGTPYKCTFQGCKMSFNKKFKMRMHRATDHGDAIEELKCTFEGCTSTFKKKRSLLKHLKRHETEFKCKVLGCEEVVKSWSALRKHIELHKKIHCIECGIVCPDKVMFHQHCRDEHPLVKKAIFDCPYDGCSKVYSRGSNLNAHIRVAHNGQRFACEVEGCGKKFRYNVTLKAHMASHEKPTCKKKARRKRKRKSLAAKLARYKGELCDLPVTYVGPESSQASASLSTGGETQRSSQACFAVFKDSSAKIVKQEETGAPTPDSVEVPSLSLRPEMPNSLMERLKTVIKAGQYIDVN